VVTTQSTSGALQNIDCLIEAAKGIFATTCSIEVQPEAVADENVCTHEIIMSVISLVGEVEWSVFMAIPRATAVAMAGKFAGFEIPYESSDLGDAIGELSNILAGDMKARLDRRGLKADISLPSVMRCDNLQVLISADTPVEKFSFSTPIGKFMAGVISSRHSERN
jgi:chemotaxis protein CheX